MSSENFPLCLVIMRPLSTCAASSPAAFRAAARKGELAGLKDCLCAFMDHAAAIRAAASTAIAFFGVRRTFEVAQPLTSDATVNLDAGLGNMTVARQKNRQLGAGRPGATCAGARNCRPVTVSE